MRYLIPGLALVAAAAGCQQQLGSSATMLAQEDIGVVQSLAVDGSYVYWTTLPGLVKRVPTTGGTPEVIASGQPNADKLLVDDTHVAWSLGQTITTLEKSSQTLTTFAAQGTVGGLSSDSNSLYWTTDSGDVNKASKAGDDFASLATAQVGTGALSAGLASIFFGGETTAATITNTAPANPAIMGGILTVPDNGGAVFQYVSSIDRLVSLTTDSDNVYWADAADSTNGTINMAALDGSNPQTLSTGETNLVSLATDSTNVYYSSSDGRLAVVSTQGGAPLPFITGPAGLVSFALDVTNIYWVNQSDGAIMTAPKPDPLAASSVPGEGSPIPQ